MIKKTSNEMGSMHEDAKQEKAEKQSRAYEQWEEEGEGYTEVKRKGERTDNHLKEKENKKRSIRTHTNVHDKQPMKTHSHNHRQIFPQKVVYLCYFVVYI